MIIPEKLPIMALPGTCLFPGGKMPLYIFESKYRDMLNDVISGNRMFCIGTLSQSDASFEGGSEILPYSTAGLLRACVMNNDGTANLIIEGVKKIKIINVENNKPYKVGEVQTLETTINDFEKIQSSTDQLKTILIANYSDRIDPNIGMQLNQILKNLESPEDTLNFAAQNFISHQEISQKLLSLESLDEQFDLIIKVLNG
mgnify:FL=1|tara:strand:+ start:53 stop:655 length:603 start_codon:yes stop_codon:yes gene_type:complete